MKVLIRVVDDWVEIYINGKFVYDGEWAINYVLMDFLKCFAQTSIDITDVELRFFEGHSTAQLTKDGKVEAVDIPLHTMTDENYWSDWDEAEIIPNIYAGEEDES